MKTIGLLLVAMLLYGACAVAAVRLPEGGAGVTPEVLAILEQVPKGAEKIRIDDMVFRVEQLEKSGFTGDAWTDGNVYYQFDSGLSTYQRNQWHVATAIIAAVANIRFIEGRSGAPRFATINVFSGDESWSEVGMQWFGQDLSIRTFGWFNDYEIVHEIMHALGYIHEHQRSDRDDYVIIHEDRICQNCCQGGSCDHNFELEDSHALHTWYDFDSVMHYTATAFTNESCSPDPTACWTIQVKEPWFAAWQDSIGQCDHLSEGDIAGLGCTYGIVCEGPIYVDSGAPTVFQAGSYCHPFFELSAALGVACDDAQILIIGGTHDYAPITIDQDVWLVAKEGTVEIR